MSGTNREPASSDGDQAAEQGDTWSLDRRSLWTWIDDALGAIAASGIDAGGLKAVCARALDTHAPALLVRAQAAGIALDHLACSALVSGYADAYGRPAGLYDVACLRAVAQGLRRGRAGSLSP